MNGHVASTWISHSVADTIAFGARLGALLQPGDLVLLQAPFGAGKTHLTKGIGQAWGVTADEVNSPSFVLVNEYTADAAHGHVPLYHADLYRIETAHELATVGLEDTMNNEGICVVEWPEHATGLLPDEHLLIRIQVTGPTERVFSGEAHGRRYHDLLAQLLPDEVTDVTGD